MRIEDRERHDDVLGKDGNDGGENNDGVESGVGDKYKHDRRQLMLSPKLLEKNSCIDKRHEGMASWINFITGSKGHDCNRSRRQKRRIYFK